MNKPDEESERQRKALIRILQTELPAVELPTVVQDDLLKRILDRTVRTWREWTQASKNRLDD
jgi:hypothetical protein